MKKVNDQSLVSNNLSKMYTFKLKFTISNNLHLVRYLKYDSYKEHSNGFFLSIKYKNQDLPSKIKMTKGFNG